jgi:DNA-binding XRE family transcriptional regulator
MIAGSGLIIKKAAVGTSLPLLNRLLAEDADIRLSALLVGQTRWLGGQLLELMPTRPSQNSPERVAKWEHYRAVIGRNIRDRRIDSGMTQEALALRSGVTRNVLIDVEFGRRGLLYERLFDIADALNIPVEDLFFGSTRRPKRKARK